MKAWARNLLTVLTAGGTIASAAFTGWAAFEAMQAASISQRAALQGEHFQAQVAVADQMQRYLAAYQEAFAANGGSGAFPIEGYKAGSPELRLKEQLAAAALLQTVERMHDAADPRLAAWTGGLHDFEGPDFEGDWQHDFMMNYASTDWGRRLVLDERRAARAAVVQRLGSARAAYLTDGRAR